MDHSLLHAYSKGVDIDGLEVLEGMSKENTVVRAGPVKSSKESIRSEIKWTQGQAGVAADEDRTM